MQQPNKFVFLVGRPGSGTTTHGGLLKNMVNRSGGNAALISTGDLCRDAKKDVNHRHHELIKSSGGAVNGGDLVSDEIIAKMIAKEISLARKEGANTFIFSGYPRTLEQVNQIQEMEKILQSDGHTIEMKFVHLEIDREGAIARIKKRRTDDAELTGESRDDDKEDAKIENRQNKYELETEPVISFLKTHRKRDLIIESTQVREKEEVFFALGLRLSNFLLEDIDPELLQQFGRPYGLEY